MSVVTTNFATTNTEENTMNNSFAGTKYCSFVNQEEIAEYKALPKNSFDSEITRKVVKNGSMIVFSIKSSFVMGMRKEVKFFVAKETFTKGLVEQVNNNIHVYGVNFDGLTEGKLFAAKIALAMSANGIGFEKIMEGLSKGYKMFVYIKAERNMAGKKYFALKPVETIASVGPLGEGSTSRFVNPSLPMDTEFGQNIVVDGKPVRLVFEEANKVVAREMKLGAGKTDAVSIGQREVLLVDTALNGGVIPEFLSRMLVLGTAWVSASEYASLGSCRMIPLKSVSAPMPKALMELEAGQIVAGGNSHKSKLNGVLVKALGMSHLEVSKLTETEARALLSSFEKEIVIGGETVRCYSFKMEVSVTNFYSLYSLEMNDDEEVVVPEMKSFYLETLDLVANAAKDGLVFDLIGHVKNAMESGVITPKKRITAITSAEVQQVAVSYGYKAATEFVNRLLSLESNVSSKYFLFNDMEQVPSLNKEEFYTLVNRFFEGDIATTVIPFDFYRDLIAAIGDDSKGFKVAAGGFEFPFMPIGNLDHDGEGYVKDVPTSLSSLMMLAIAMRNSRTEWGNKYLNHMAELNGTVLKQVQKFNVRGAYLAAVSGFWLKPTEVSSFGDKEGRVTSAKLPILFDQAITGLNNTHVSPYSAEELEQYALAFGRIAFVSPEYFLSQENDGDGDLVKIMQGFKSIPTWKGQPAFANKMVAAYTKGEWSGLKLSLKAYKHMAFEEFHKGNYAAKQAKDNVAIMATNSYKVKAVMGPYLESADAETRQFAKMICEASAYLVQYEAMRAAKHDGAVSNFPGCKCSPEKRVVGTLTEYTANWVSLFNEYFGYEVEEQDMDSLSALLSGLYECELTGLSAPVALEVASVCLDNTQFSYAIQQKGYARNILAFVGEFPLAKEDKDSYKEVKAKLDAAIIGFKVGAPYSVVFTGYAGYKASTIRYSRLAAEGDIFGYVLKAMHDAYTFTGPKLVKEKDVVVAVEAATVVEATASVVVASNNSVETMQAPFESADSSVNSFELIENLVDDFSFVGTCTDNELDLGVEMELASIDNSVEANVPSEKVCSVPVVSTTVPATVVVDDSIAEIIEEYVPSILSVEVVNTFYTGPVEVEVTASISKVLPSDKPVSLSAPVSVLPSKLVYPTDWSDADVRKLRYDTRDAILSYSPKGKIKKVPSFN